jgi:hypothetical protein
MKIQVEVFWVVTPCSDVVEYQRFGEPCYLHLQGEVVSYHITTRRHNSEDRDWNHINITNKHNKLDQYLPSDAEAVKNRKLTISAQCLPPQIQDMLNVCQIKLKFRIVAEI